MTKQNNGAGLNMQIDFGLYLYLVKWVVPKDVATVNMAYNVGIFAWIVMTTAIIRLNDILRRNWWGHCWRALLWHNENEGLEVDGINPSDSDDGSYILH